MGPVQIICSSFKCINHKAHTETLINLMAFSTVSLNSTTLSIPSVIRVLCIFDSKIIILNYDLCEPTWTTFMVCEYSVCDNANSVLFYHAVRLYLLWSVPSTRLYLLIYHDNSYHCIGTTAVATIIIWPVVISVIIYSNISVKNI